MTAAVAFDKGRAQGFSLRRVVQQTAALSMASGCLFRMRWIPSEWNPADGPSRGGWEPSVPSRVLKDDSSATGGSSDMAVQEGKAANNRGFAKGCPDRGDASDMGHRVGDREEAGGEEEGSPFAEEEKCCDQSSVSEGSLSQDSHQIEVPDAVDKFREVGEEKGEADPDFGFGGALKSRCSDGQPSGLQPPELHLDGQQVVGIQLIHEDGLAESHRNLEVLLDAP